MIAPTTTSLARASKREEEEALEAAVAESVGRFDMGALLDLLFDMGYRLDDIAFESYPTTASQPSLLQKIEFKKAPSRHVVITTNFGLLGPQTPLPSYFLKVLDAGDIDDEAFLSFVRFFDHTIIQALVLGVYPERTTGYFRDFEANKRCYLQLSGLRSLATLHWLFQHVFPELCVEVSHAALTRELMGEPVRLGRSRMGDGLTLGGVARVPMDGVDVRLTCDDEQTSRGRPWAEEIHRRLGAAITPVLADMDLDMRIALVVRAQRGFARLERGGYLGFDRVRGGEARHRVVQVFKGRLRRDRA